MRNNLSRRFGRKYEIRKESKKILIFTNGEKTEVNYFSKKKQEIRKNTIEIDISFYNSTPMGLVDNVMKLIQNNNIKIDDSTDNDECWVVFDKDDFDGNFDNAINKAESNNLKVAYSNESFELWFLLHFIPLTSAISRDDYKTKIEDNIIKITKNKKFKYEKNLEGMSSLIINKEKDAIRNAKKLLIMHKEKKSFQKKNPSTTVHLLVESLNKLKE